MTYRAGRIHCNYLKMEKKLNMKISLREKTSYSVGSIGNNLINGLMSTYLIVFYTDYMLLPAYTISVLFLVAKIWDGINDPIMGIIIDNTDTRFGKFRPYLLFIALDCRALHGDVLRQSGTRTDGKHCMGLRDLHSLRNELYGDGHPLLGHDAVSDSGYR